MPFDTLAAARESDFPSSLDDVDLTLGQINWLSRVFDSLRDAGEVDEPMAVAIAQFGERYRIEGSGDQRRYVLKEGKGFKSIEEAKIANALTEVDGHPLTLDQINMFVWQLSSKITEEITVGESMDGFGEKIPGILDACKERFREEWEWDEGRERFIPWWEAEQIRMEQRGKRKAKSGDFLKSDERRRMAKQAIWVPDTEDRDKEWVSAEEIEKGFYRNAIRKANMLPSETGINHEGETIKGIFTVQDYIAPTDLEIDGVVIPEGSHIREHHFDPASPEATKVWEGILSGDFKGVSPQGDWKGRVADIPERD